MPPPAAVVLPQYKRRLPIEPNTEAVAEIIVKNKRENKISQKQFSCLSGLPEPRISRIRNNTNYRGDECHVTFEELMCIAMGLQKGEEGFWAVMRAAYPAYFAALRDKKTFVQFLCELDESDNDI